MEMHMLDWPRSIQIFTHTLPNLSPLKLEFQIKYQSKVGIPRFKLEFQVELLIRWESAVRVWNSCMDRIPFARHILDILDKWAALHKKVPNVLTPTFQKRKRKKIKNFQKNFFSKNS